MHHAKTSVLVQPVQCEAQVVKREYSSHLFLLVASQHKTFPEDVRNDNKLTIGCGRIYYWTHELHSLGLSGAIGSCGQKMEIVQIAKAYCISTTWQ